MGHSIAIPLASTAQANAAWALADLWNKTNAEGGAAVAQAMVQIVAAAHAGEPPAMIQPSGTGYLILPAHAPATMAYYARDLFEDWDREIRVGLGQLAEKLDAVA